MTDQYIRIDHRGAYLHVEVLPSDNAGQVSGPRSQDDDEEMADLTDQVEDMTVTSDVEMSLEEQLDQMMLDPNQPPASEQQSDEAQTAPLCSNAKADAEDLALAAALGSTSLHLPCVILRPFPEHIRYAVIIPLQDRSFTVGDGYFPDSVVRAVTHLDAFAGYNAGEIIAFLRAQRVFLVDEAIVGAMIREYGLGF